MQQNTQITADTTDLSANQIDDIPSDMQRNLVALTTITRKEVGRFLRIWSQTLLPPIITQSLYFVIFGTFIGSRIGLINELSYMSFIIPGLVMMGVITASFSNVASSFFGSKFQKNIEEMLVAPVPNWVIILGFTLGGVLRGLLVGVIILAISLFFERPQIYNLGIILIFILLTTVVFSLGGLVNAIFAKKFDDIAIFPTFVLTPLTYLGGVFYSISQLPPFWQRVSYFNPIVYIIDGFRYGFYGKADINLWYSFGILILLTIILWSYSWYLLKKGTGLKS